MYKTLEMQSGMFKELRSLFLVGRAHELTENKTAIDASELEVSNMLWCYGWALIQLKE